MPLSEYEQRVLDDLERDLGADPKLKSAMTRPRRTVGRLVTALLGPSGSGRRAAKGSAKGAIKGPAKGRQGFMTRLEERFERRREQGDV